MGYIYVTCMSHVLPCSISQSFGTVSVIVAWPHICCRSTFAAWHGSRAAREHFFPALNECLCCSLCNNHNITMLVFNSVVISSCQHSGELLTKQSLSNVHSNQNRSYDGLFVNWLHISVTMKTTLRMYVLMVKEYFAIRLGLTIIQICLSTKRVIGKLCFKLVNYVGKDG